MLRIRIGLFGFCFFLATTAVADSWPADLPAVSMSSAAYWTHCITAGREPLTNAVVRLEVVDLETARRDILERGTKHGARLRSSGTGLARIGDVEKLTRTYYFDLPAKAAQAAAEDMRDAGTLLEFKFTHRDISATRDQVESRISELEAEIKRNKSHWKDAPIAWNLVGRCFKGLLEAREALRLSEEDATMEIQVRSK